MNCYNWRLLPIWRFVFENYGCRRKADSFHVVEVALDRRWFGIGAVGVGAGSSGSIGVYDSQFLLHRLDPRWGCRVRE